MMTGCGDEFQHTTTISGVIVEIRKGDDMLLIEGKIDESNQENLYEIPVPDASVYSVGQNVKVKVYDRTVEDKWDLNDMKFEVDIEV